MGKLTVQIHNVKCIKDLKLELPVEKGLYALTGLNGSGKSTIAACASTAFYSFSPTEFFGITGEDASITLIYGGNTKFLFAKGGRYWKRKGKNVFIGINGFYEGSLIFGNRFRDTSIRKVKNLAYTSIEQQVEADDFIRINLGIILQGNANFYEKLYSLDDPSVFDGTVFFYEKDGKRISQFHMSTGENLLISILHSLLIRINDRNDTGTPNLVILDEIELALHPSSLKRLVAFLEDISNRFNYAIYFSTHSLELIGGIIPDHIFYIERHSDGSMEILNPCYPAYATRMLYDHSGYDNVILVEDDLAKIIIDKLLRNNHLLNSRLVHILPSGGYSNVLKLADDVVKNNLLGRRASICIILDGDVKDDADRFAERNSLALGIPRNYLPIPSLEKYLKNKLYLHVDHTLFRRLNDYFFQYKSLTNLIEIYESTGSNVRDNDGKKFYEILDCELKERQIDKSQLINYIVDYLMETEMESVNKITNFLRKQFNN